VPGQAAIRPLTPGDVPAVAALLRAHLGPPPAPDLERFLEATLLEDPWADPELPSLVAEEGGRIAGFIACQPRRLELDGEPLRAAVCSHLTVAPEHRAGVLAARLARTCLRGPQRLTYSDAAGDLVVRLWRVLGGDVDTARACDWVVLLRPGRWAAQAVAELARRRGYALPVAALPLHAVWRSTRRDLLAPDPGVAGEPADGAALAAELDTLTAGLRLRPLSDAPHLAHVLTAIAASGRRAECRIVRRDGQAIGLWACLARPGGTAQVLALVAREREGAAVFRHLARAAHAWGSIALAGRLEPHLRDAIRPPVPALALMRLPVVHTRDDAVRAALASTAAYLPRLETEWWAA
jgi:hypothetical protein